MKSQWRFEINFFKDFFDLIFVLRGKSANGVFHFMRFASHPLQSFIKYIHECFFIGFYDGIF